MKVAKNQPKPLKVSDAYQEALARLATNPDFVAFEKLCKIEQDNIIIAAFKVPSSSPDLKTMKAWHEGRVWELRKMLKTFAEAKSKSDI